MNNFMYKKLAWDNLKKNKDIFFPFGLSCGVMAAMFYMLLSIYEQVKDKTFFGSRTTIQVLYMGVWVCGIFAAVVIFYTNHFLVKGRAREFGLYSILGMEKKHIGKVLFWEMILTLGFSISGGMAAGILFSQLMFLILLRIAKLETAFRFHVSIAAAGITVIVFLCILISVLVSNKIRIFFLQPIRLLHEANAGEKEPKAKWVIGIAGLVCLFVGYYIALMQEPPIFAVRTFFLAVLFVIAGTYALFLSGSIIFLKILKKNKNFYYHKRHFITVSGMMYRMKQNAAGLSNICILSTAVLIVLSSTLSLYFGLEGSIKQSFHKDIRIEVYWPQYDNAEEAKKAIGAIDNFSILKKAEALLFAEDSKWRIEEIKIGDFAARVVNENKSFDDFAEYSYEDTPQVGRAFLVVPDLETLLEVSNGYAGLLYPGEEGISVPIGYFYEFNLKGSEEEKIAFSGNLENALQNTEASYGMDITSIFEIRRDYREIYGSIFFVGIYLAALFLLTTVLIIYYKQISEGYEDKERYVILQKVGMSKKEVKKTVQDQILFIFFLPVLVAVVHVAVAFPILEKMLYILNLSQQRLFIRCTVGTVFVFFILYGIVYALTARVYYRLVNRLQNNRH